ncbi:DUF397 domain-containing protein [Streptomyces sp. Je 1-369]|uniref:DUF397 domain-containing protein n=1 Tax=Streptomyces sp. Je 1-369 TaxID=2966192 RepID=UPI002285B176|nr:DUF397 domain-containing protein [Streptomyces sp. Je 1-369]WAL96766.1 DUF397 domain-containing protein [Streptomyces sp. Je 1-369]
MSHAPVAEVLVLRGADGNECVELARDEPSLLLRESEDPDRTLTLAPQALAAYLRRLLTP